MNDDELYDDAELEPNEDDYAYDETEEEDESPTDEPSYVTKDEFLEMKSMLAELKEAIAASTKAKPSTTTFPTDLHPYSPEADTRQFLRIEEKMMTECKKLYPDLTEDMQDEIKDLMGNYRTLTDIKKAQEANQHTMIADLVYGKHVREKRHVPRGMNSRMSPSRGEAEPISREDAFMRQVRENEKLIGQKFTKKEIEEARRHYKKNGN